MSKSAVLIAVVISLGVHANHLNIPSNAQIVEARNQSIRDQIQTIEQELTAQQGLLAALKEQIKIQEARLSSLSITALNQVSDRYDLLETQVVLDGQNVQLPFNDHVLKGKHDIKVEQLFRGSANVGAGFEQNTFRLSGHTLVDVASSEQATVNIVTTQGDKAGGDQLAIRIDLGSQKVPSEMPVVEPELTSEVAMIVADPAGSPFELKAHRVWVDGKLIDELTAPVVTPTGIIVFQGPLKVGAHKIDVVLSYLVDGAKVAGLVTNEIRLSFSKDITVQANHSIRLSMQGYTQSTVISTPPLEDAQGEMKVLDEATGLGGP
jgi:hypothetical protein